MGLPLIRRFVGKRYFFGFVLPEILLVMFLIGFIATIGISVYRGQIQKAYDARRKSDLHRLKLAAEEYEKDYDCYPDTLPLCTSSTNELEDYIGEIPCDPELGYDYLYETDGLSCPRWFRIYARLKNQNDASSSDLGCNFGCGPGYWYTYYVSSPNAPEPLKGDSSTTPTPQITVTATPSPSPTIPPTATPSPPPGPTSTSSPTPSSTSSPTPTTGGGGAIAHVETKTGTATGNPTSVSTSSSVTATNNIYLAVVVSKSNTSVSSVSGLGVSWTEIANQCSGRNAQGLSVWKAASTPSSSGVVTATFSSSPSEAAISVSRYSGATTTGNIGKANTNGVNGGCSGGTDSSSPAVNLTTTSANSFAFGAVAKRNRTFTPGSGFAERADFDSGGGGSAAGIAIEDKGISSPSTFSVYGTTSGTTDWAIVAVEIK